ncbi:MAG: hypothetical protein ACXVGC_12655 [Mycobacteriaceae bacterium]
MAEYDPPEKKFEILRNDHSDYYGIYKTVRAVGPDHAVEQVAHECRDGEVILVRFKKRGGISVYGISHSTPSFARIASL